ncbi:hypothetical protein BO70DRAFT_362893 [Aspergillus heteromorphus CBS 117.55]|uniref:Uncharacterized protein n=1 Tax=Aspergillus heteromorphus CBS 117.55 TaxID=1448321 RepID=A0A317VXN4_9EURO|nr:uncharacterized protein BO70DRAFT_362893 [Aspergillus heteromorphus CBS 117.55]PWY79114.1 hypothetical protein BO70DRAFT_362893 [Aspergillus heteromorphus CBS 117.55]
MTHGVFLYRKSRLFWTFPRPPVGLPRTTDTYYTLTSEALPDSNPGLSYARGPQSPKDYPVKMLHPARYLEGLLLMRARDIVGQHTDLWWKRHLQEWMDVLEDANNPNLEFDRISDGPFRQFVAFWRVARSLPHLVDHYFLILYVILNGIGQLPPPPTIPLDPEVADLQRRLTDLVVSSPGPFINRTLTHDQLTLTLQDRNLVGDVSASKAEALALVMASVDL